jgi:hypothetical protein
MHQECRNRRAIQTLKINVESKARSTQARDTIPRMWNVPTAAAGVLQASNFNVVGLQ